MRSTTFWSAATSLLPFLPATAAAAAAGLTTSVKLAIPASQQIPNPNALPASTHATLTTIGLPPRSAPLTAANTFVFDNLTAGSYLADIHCPLYGFAPLRVDVGLFEDALKVRVWETYRGNDWENKGEEIPAKKVATATAAAPGVVYEARVLGGKVFFQERASFSVFGILKNPMILMGIVSLAMFIGVPKLIENMDPETRAEFEATRKENPMASLLGGGGGGGAGGAGGAGGPANFDMAGFLSGHSASKNNGGSGAGSGNASGAEGGSSSAEVEGSAGGGAKGSGKKRR